MTSAVRCACSLSTRASTWPDLLVPFSDGGQNVARLALRRLVAEKLADDWSPQQISGWLTRTFPGDPRLHVSHETIYLSLFVQTRGVLKQALIAHLRRRKRMRRSKLATGKQRGRRRSQFASARPKRRTGPCPGTGRATCCRAPGTPTSRRWSSGTPASMRLPVVQALRRRSVEGLMVSLTWDARYELAAHKTLTVATQVQVYFCDPQSPWQRGTNENTNGLLRQYFPHGTDLANYTQADLDTVAQRLNSRPRKTLGYDLRENRRNSCDRNYMHGCSLSARVRRNRQQYAPNGIENGTHFRPVGGRDHGARAASLVTNVTSCNTVVSAHLG